MNKRWLAVLLALLMVMGTVGMAAAETGDDEVDLEEKEGQGPPAHIQKMLEMKADMEDEENDDEEDEDGQQGPPAFVREMLREKFTIMNKNKLMIHGNPFVSDLPPVIKEGRTLIPVGAVVKGLGADDVEWDDKTKTVTIVKGKTTIELVIGENSYKIYKDGSNVAEEFEMDTEAQILGDRTFVPLKFSAVALGEEVKWNPETGIINVGRVLGQERAAQARMIEENDDEDDDEDEEDED